MPSTIVSESFAINALLEIFCFNFYVVNSIIMAINSAVDNNKLIMFVSPMCTEVCAYNLCPSFS